MSALRPKRTLALGQMSDKCLWQETLPSGMKTMMTVPSEYRHFKMPALRIVEVNDAVG
ncbi:MAG: hypothetical protein ABJQ80_08780 [Lentilitoribacter sp.]